MNFEICDIVRSSDSSLVVEVTDSLGSSIGCKEAGIDDKAQWTCCPSDVL